MMIALLAMLLPWHDESVSSSRIDVGRHEVRVAFTMTREDAALVGEPGAYLLARVRFWSDGRELAGEFVRAEGLTFALRYVSEQPIGALRMRCEALRDRVKKHTHVADFADGRTIVFDKDRVEAEVGAAAPGGSFVWLGVEHIVTGWDHLVFLLALLLIATSIGQVAKLVTAFTVAHSITLGLTALRVIGPPAGLVEAVIAASIVYVAVENMFVKERKWRWVLVFAFGLVHGMGFGGVLLEMNLASPALALLGFNVGVELGQLAVVALVWPLFALARRREEFYRTWVVRGLSGAAAAAGMVWFVGRVSASGV